MDEQQTLVMNWRSAMLALTMLCSLAALAYLYARQIERGSVLCLGGYKAKWAFNESVHYPYVLPVVFVASLVLMGWALFKIWRLRARYLGWLENHRSDDDSFNPVWLSHFILIGVPLALVWVLESILGHIFGFSYFETFWADFVALLLLLFISIEALTRIQQPFPKMTDGPAVRDTAEPEQQERDWKAEGVRVKTAIVDNGWYLETSLSLQDLARYVGSNHAYVSRALNQGLGVSYSKLINHLRVEHAKNLIDAGQQSILEIALASGFGSKASFNRAFKLHTGVTPSGYRRA